MRLYMILLFLSLLSESAVAQATVTSFEPKTLAPGSSTRVTLKGKNLGDSLRAFAGNRATVSVDDAQAENAVLTVTLPGDAALGPMGVWIATKSGPANPMTFWVDDLVVINRPSENHSRETAQEVATSASVDGSAVASKSDFYRFRANEGQRIAFEVLTQSIESKMDPVLLISDQDGNILATADDDGVGPEARLSHRFIADGDYFLEVRDSRHGAGQYHLRVGDFPLLGHCDPLAIQAGTSTSVRFVTSDGSDAESRDIQVAADQTGSVMVSTRAKNGKSSAWAPIRITNLATHSEPTSDSLPQNNDEAVLTVPVAINGRLATPGEQDVFEIRGQKDQTVRIGAVTRELRSVALVQMQLFEPGGSKVAETKVADSDQWSFDYKFPADGNYQLKVSDLLGRGGDGHGYHIEVTPSGTFQIAIKPDAKKPEQFAVETETGAVAIDLSISRFGYDGMISVKTKIDGGIEVLNPVIPAKAKTARVYLVPEAGWAADAIRDVELWAEARDDPSVRVKVSSADLRRAKHPHVPFPIGWKEGTLVLSGVDPTPAFFRLEPDKPLQFARPLKTHKASLKLKRIDKNFKAGVSVLPRQASDGWRVAVRTDKEVFDCTFTKTGDATPDSVPVKAYAEFNGRGRMQTIDVPLQWVDPVGVRIEAAGPLFPGATGRLIAKVVRQGDDPQSVTLRFPDLPEGFVAPESVAIAAEGSEAEFDLKIPADWKSSLVEIRPEITSKYHDSEFSITERVSAVVVEQAPEQLQVYPAEIQLAGAQSRRQLVVSGTDVEGLSRDWTGLARIDVADQNVAELRGTTIFAKSNGETEVTIQLGALQETVPLRVTGAETPRPTQFESEVLVALSKQGCNSGACHGSPSGKGMFRLSLRAFDRKLDEWTLIGEEAGRRVNRIEPEKSLLLLKPLMKISHGGGKQLHESDEAYSLLRTWIEEGARPDSEGTPRCERLEVYPNSKRVLRRRQGGQQLSVLAHFTDGSRRDVTHLVAYESSNTAVATVDVNGRVTDHARGEAVVLVRFLEHIESVPLMFVEEVAGFVWEAPEEANYIDQLVNAKLRRLRYTPAPTCNDSEFLRRVFLDVIGILPTVEETEAFLQDSAADKRERLIDELFEREEYAKFWALKWGDLLKMTKKSVGDDGVYKYHRWVEAAFRDNMPYDQFARELVTASGSTFANPPANFYRTATDMNECVETISQVFLGARLQCAKCHNHPFERWTQDNYYGLGAFFQRVQRRKTQRPGEMFVWTSGSGEVTQPRTGETMKPWLPRDGSVEVDGVHDRRAVFAKWLVEPDNPYFARIEANRLWSQLFSRGIVDPIDDFRDSNPPSNGPLLDALAKDFAASGFDRKHLLKTILRSRTYQASYLTNSLNQDDMAYFSHQKPRLLGAEQLLDAVNHVTGLTQTLGGLPAGTKATHLPAPDLVKIDFLKVFGQPERSTVCACERTDDSNLAMAIELFNGPAVHGKLRDKGNRFRRAVAAGKDTEEVLKELYLAAVCRPPTAAEINAALEHCAKRQDAADGLEDVCWALLNTDEFLFQH